MRVSPTAALSPYFTLLRRLCVPPGLLTLTLIYFWPQVVGGRALYWGDIGLYFLPMQTFLKTSLTGGRVPLWNPLILCGTPYVGNPQTWPLYPFTALLAFVSPTQFINLTVAAHVWLAGIGTYLFARRALKLPRGAAALSAVTFMFGGQLVSKEQFPNMVQAAAWLPWVLWALDSLLRRWRVRDALALGTVLGLQLLAAHAQMTFLTLYLAAAYGVFGPGPWRPTTLLRRVLPKGRIKTKQDSLLPWYPNPPFREDPMTEERGNKVVGLLLLAFAVAGGLAMGQLLPTLSLLRDAARQHLAFGTVNRFYLPPDELLNFVLPHLHGSPFAGDWTARGNFWETCCYVGIIPFALAVWGLWKHKAARFWALVFAVSLLLALGGNGGLYRLAYWVLPGFRAFHDPARCLLPACFALSLLAGLGAARLRVSRVLVAGLCLLAFADLAHFGQTLYPLIPPSALSPVSPNVAAVQSDPDVRAGQARVLAPTEGVWLRFTNYKSYRQETPNYQSLWADTLTPNLTMTDGLPEAFGYEPVALKNAQGVAGGAAHEFETKATPKKQQSAAGDAGALGVKYVALCRTDPPADLPGLVVVREAKTLRPPARVFLCRNTRWQPRARLVGDKTPVTLTQAGPDRVTLTWTSPRAGRLVLADTDAAGWAVTLDGLPVPVHAYGGSLRELDIPTAGPHRAEFAYAPEAWRLGLYVSLLTLSALCAAGAFAVTRNFTRRGGIPHPSGE